MANSVWEAKHALLCSALLCSALTAVLRVYHRQGRFRPPNSCEPARASASVACPVLFDKWHALGARLSRKRGLGRTDVQVGCIANDNPRRRDWLQATVRSSDMYSCA
ncbi:uncharacterized protein UDID_18075 [Ustilago sp. UG-2017a]|nr:uncharacterized protein UDID_18075 [Ustilago sp. UG-2017a]